MPGSSTASDVRVIDISTGGILVESDGAPLAPQSNVVFELSAQTGTMLMPARVLRSQPVEGSTRYSDGVRVQARALDRRRSRPPLAMKHRRQHRGSARILAARGRAIPQRPAWCAATPTTFIRRRRISI